MPRQKNDGRGRLGGRQKGSTNKEKPLKTFLRAHSLNYFVIDEETGLSAFDKDILELDAKDRVNAELSLLKYHTAQMQATSVDMSLTDDKQSLSERLSNLAKEED